MASPSMVQRSGDTLIVRSVVSGDRLYLEPSDSQSAGSASSAAVAYSEPVDSDSPLIDDYVEESDKVDLPQCKIKRNYDCSDCNYFTQNPRHFLTHLRDVHGEKVKIYYCPNCLYASRHFQKLLRHMKMVHGVYKATNSANPPKKKTKETSSPNESTNKSEEQQQEEPHKNSRIEVKSEEKPARNKQSKIELKCSVCDFTATSFTLLTRHERKEHLKTKYFPCSKCNYATHIKARFTKHVKYHSMPMIKCEVCDFRTPYKWNLDRHMKNHGGAGAFCCSECNFTADIKQSLTVHEMNHHVPAVGAGSAAGGGSGGGGPTRRRNRVGATDVAPLAASRPRRRRARARPTLQPHPQEDINDFNMTMQSENADICAIDNNSNNNLDYNNDNCFKMKFEDSDYSGYVDKQINENENVLKIEWMGNNLQEEEVLQRIKTKKTPRPIPNLIPLMQTSNQLSKNCTPLNLSVITKSMLENSSNDCKTIRSSEKHYPETDKMDIQCNDDSIDQSQFDYLSTKSDESSQHSLPRVVKTITKKKNSSIFDKLYKEKMIAAVESGNLTCKDCSYISKSLSEHSIHEKICASVDLKLNQLTIPPSGLGSTRCQNCRHRCKSSLDLVVHLQTCLLTKKVSDISKSAYKTEKVDFTTQNQPMSEEEASADDPQVPHPMENVVFVWNPIMNNNMSLASVDNFDVNVDNNKISTSTPNNNQSSREQDNTNAGKKVFKCPHCTFWASTASRFHVHIVGHLNKKPFECSLCSYKSNWRWDITKHIRLKSVRDPEHTKAKVLMTDETGRRNYSKYNKYLTLMQISDPSVDVASASLHLFNRKYRENVGNTSACYESFTMLQSDLPENSTANPSDTLMQVTSQLEDYKVHVVEENIENKRSRKSMWKCKKCDYRNASKEALLMHVRKHSKSSTIQPQQDEPAEGPDTSEVISASDASSVSYRCGHCNQVSNWKHVIQRHCRLKHNGDVKVIVGSKVIASKNSNSSSLQSITTHIKCSKCPFTTTSKAAYENHLKQHSITSESTFKCFICPYYVKTEIELMQHLPLHGISDPEKYGAQVLNCKSAVAENTQIKRYKCSDCPYESNSKSQFTYHEQFHKANNAPFKCDICNYQVSKRHLLHQHMKVHGFIQPQKDAIEVVNIPKLDTATTLTNSNNLHNNTNQDDLIHMWVSFCGEFQKMFKCRSCPYVNLRRNNILDHEKMHSIDGHMTNLDAPNMHKCTECNYTCNNLDVYLSHAKVHKDDYVKVFCPVNQLKTDEQQILELKEILSELNLYKYKSDPSYSTSKEETNDISECKKIPFENKQPNKFIYFCSDCPARFLFEKELQIHYKFHCIRLPYQCQICSYTARQHSHLLAHKNVHFKDYQEKTKALHNIHTIHPEHPQPKVVAVATFVNETEPVWIVVADAIKRQTTGSKRIEAPTIENITSSKSSKHHFCTKCPAKFFKISALNYHLTLHNGEGTYKCRECDYAVKTIGNLAKHETVHGDIDSRMDYESSDETNYKSIPLSGTDLFQHKTKAEKKALSEKLVTRPNDHFPPVLQADPQFGLLMHGNPDFIYPTYLKNGRPKEKRYKCHKCPSAFEKREQYKVHLSLHGSKQRYKCELCDYSVKYYANYVQHMRKHQMNADAQAARKGVSQGEPLEEFALQSKSDTKLAIKSLPRQSYKDRSKLSISDQQTLKLLHRRRSSVASNKDVSEERKVYRCTYCPYTNQRRDALDNHMRRHASVSGINGNFTCHYCDYAAPQSQFLRDHMKVHFHQPKHIAPEYFTNFEGIKISISKVNDVVSNTVDVCNQKCLFDVNQSVDSLLNNNNENKIYVVLNTGEKVI